MLERLQKILSARGIASRRKAEEYIEQGLVKVNGEVATLGQKADALFDRIEVDGQVLKERTEMLYYVMNKPMGVETSNVSGGNRGVRGVRATIPFDSPLMASSVPSVSSDSSVSSTVRDLLPAHLEGKIYPVGRLDKDSEGLLLFTNDGVLSFRLTHPKFTHEKEYQVMLDRTMEPAALKSLQEGFELDGFPTKPLRAWKTAPNVVHIVLTEGRNRQIRRMCQHVGYTVKKLKRIRIMTLVDEKLKPGQLRALTAGERKALLRSVSLDPNPQEQDL